MEIAAAIPTFPPRLLFPPLSENQHRKEFPAIYRFALSSGSFFDEKILSQLVFKWRLNVWHEGQASHVLPSLEGGAAGHPTLNLGRNSRKSIEVFQELSNYSAHKITYICKREYIKEKIDEYRALIDKGFTELRV